ncbi:MAG: hypothetical protein DMF28_00735, partial [Verrucomicrobia bacterium]
NEPPFAERLKIISEQGGIPETIQEEYVRTVVGCYVGNPYGYSWAAQSDYESMIRSFSPREVSFMVRLPRTEGLVGRRIAVAGKQRQRFIKALTMLDKASVPSSAQSDYISYMKEAPLKEALVNT